MDFSYNLHYIFHLFFFIVYWPQSMRIHAVSFVCSCLFSIFLPIRTRTHTHTERDTATENETKLRWYCWLFSKIQFKIITLDNFNIFVASFDIEQNVAANFAFVSVFPCNWNFFCLEKMHCLSQRTWGMIIKTRTRLSGLRLLKIAHWSSNL